MGWFPVPGSRLLPVAVEPGGADRYRAREPTIALQCDAVVLPEPDDASLLGVATT